MLESIVWVASYVVHIDVTTALIISNTFSMMDNWVKWLQVCALLIEASWMIGTGYILLPYSTLLSYYLTLLRITNILDLDAENEKLIGPLYLSLQTQCSTAGQNPNEYYLLYWSRVHVWSAAIASAPVVVSLNKYVHFCSYPYDLLNCLYRCFGLVST